jgi:hypothetical protein
MELREAASKPLPAARRERRRESPCERTNADATGRGASAFPLGMALLREAAPVGSATASELRLRGKSEKVAGREPTSSPHPPARWWDEHPLGASEWTLRTLHGLRFGGGWQVASAPSKESPRQAGGVLRSSRGKAQGSIGRRVRGNAPWSQRTSWWTKALRPSESDRRARTAPLHGGRQSGTTVWRATARGHRPRWPGLDGRHHSATQLDSRFPGPGRRGLCGQTTG